MPSYFYGVNWIAGLASGLNTQQIVEDLMRVARAPLDRMLQKKQILEWKQEDYRNINQALMDFRVNYASPMRLQGTFLVKKAISSDETVVTATPGGSATTGTYSINVVQLAEVASDISSSALSTAGQKIDPDATLESQKAKFASPWGATTTLSFSITTYDPNGTPNSKVFTVDTTVDSLNAVLTRINAETSLGVTAFYESSTDKVVISTTRTGDYATNEIEIADVSDTFALGTLALSPTAQGKNAVVDINGLTGIQQYENTFTLNEVTFTVKKTTGGTPVLVTVTNDTDAVFETVKSFIEQFNALLDAINGELNEKSYPDYLPLTDEQKKELTDYEIEQWQEKARSGLLRNDSILRDTVYRLRRAITTPVTGLTGYDRLYDLGITTGYYWEGGRLYIDETKLREAINADPEGVMELFTHSADNYDEQGLGVRIYNEINQAVDRITAEAGNPSSFSLYDNSYIGCSIRELDDRISTTEERLQQLEARYWRQFTAMEQAIAQLNSQSLWLSQQFNAYSGG